jgi:hypothetical protein
MHFAEFAVGEQFLLVHERHAFLRHARQASPIAVICDRDAKLNMRSSKPVHESHHTMTTYAQITIRCY